VEASFPSHIHVLIVEDSPGDARLIALAFQKGSVRPNLHWVENGVDALSFLHQAGKYARCPRPHLILLDLNLPGKSGIEVLSAIKTNPQFQAIPTIVLTTSEDELEILRCYQQHANCYLVKPSSFQQFQRAISGIEAFWLNLAKLPR